MKSPLVRVVAIPLLVLAIASTLPRAFAFEPTDLDVGVAGHAFDHLGSLDEQAPAAIASGCNIIYATGFGWIYEGMRSPAQMKQSGDAIAAYVRKSKKDGIHLAIGYVCATSIVDLPHFDQNWPADFRAQFSSPPAQWLQQDAHGKALPSWYGGKYAPACMNNPDWRKYEKAVVRMQLERGFDGIFFDNPTVHPQGCYCPHCMKAFAGFLAGKGVKLPSAEPSVDDMRKLAAQRPNDFLQFRAAIASGFLADMRRYARTINSHALITCNNSLNSIDSLFRQIRTYGYNIHRLSQVEDLVVVEDMSSLPRTLADGSMREYGPAYEVLHAIAHGKPVVAITLADGDYYTPPDLTRLAMAEAAAHGSSYLLWPTWPQNMRQKMGAAVRPQADLLRQHANLLNNARQRADVLLSLPYQRWIDTSNCRAMELAQALTAANVQFRVVCEEGLVDALDAKQTHVLLLESAQVLSEAERKRVEQSEKVGGVMIAADKPDWLKELQTTVREPSLKIEGPPQLRAVVRDQPKRVIVHLLNLNVRRVSSFEDSVTPAQNVVLDVRLPFALANSVQAITADPQASSGALKFTSTQDSKGTILRVQVRRIEVSTILVIE